MPASPKSPKPLYGLPARYPSSGRRCHSQKRILMLFSLIFLVSSGSMIILHVTSPFSRPDSLSCRSSSSSSPHSSSSSSSSPPSNCGAIHRSSRWQDKDRSRPVPIPDDEQNGDINRGINGDNSRNDPFRNHDRPRAALPHLIDNGIPDLDQPRPRQPEQQLQQPPPSPPSIELEETFTTEHREQPAVAGAGAEEPAHRQQIFNNYDNNGKMVGEEEEDKEGTIVYSNENVVSPQFKNVEISLDEGKDEDETEDEDEQVDGGGEQDDVQDTPQPTPFEETLDRGESSESDPDAKYLVYLPYAGITNQFYGMLRGMEVAKATGRTLIIPPITASSHDKSKQNQPWSKFLDLDRFVALTGVKVVEFHQMRDVDRAEMTALKCGITCGFGSKREIDFTAKGFLKQWKFDLTLSPLRQDVNKLEAITSLLTPYKQDRYVCISNTYKITVKDKQEWERFGQHLHFTEELEEFVREFLDRNLESSSPVFDPSTRTTVTPIQRYIAIHARRGDFFNYCSGSFPGPKFVHCFPSTEELAARVDRVQTRLSPAVEGTTSTMGKLLPVFVATNERRPEELKKFAQLGWRYLDHDEMGTADKLGVFGPMVVDWVFMAHAQALIGIQMSTFSRVGALRQRDWHQRQIEYM